MTRRLAVCARCGDRPVGYIGRASCYVCEPSQRPPRPICGRCNANPVGYFGRECCFTCVPRKRRAPHVCKRCGNTDIYMSGLCRRCHRLAPLVDSCRDCLAWGVTRHHKWLCEGCRGWRARYGDVAVDCPSCARHVIVNHRGFCRLCCRMATTANQLDPTHKVLEVAALNRAGQQLYFADMILNKRGKHPGTRRPSAGTRRRSSWPPGIPVTHEQHVLFTWPRTFNADIITRLRPPIPALAAALHRALTEHGERHGWSQAQHDATWRGVRVLLALQNTPGALISVSEATVLLDVAHTSVRPVLDVLESVDMIRDDREPALQSWFETRSAGLPDDIGHELASWFHALRDGSTTPPRMRPRNTKTVRSVVGIVLPILTTWAADGHQSLREITRDHVIDALPTTNPQRGHALSALRGLFRYLKARRLVFINPTTRLRGDPRPPLQLRPIELDHVREALNSNDPVRAAITGLIAFHALRNGQVRRLMLTDIRDGRVQVDDNRIVLAEPARHRLDTWLTERARRWPDTANPHLFITARTAVRDTHATSGWLLDKVGVAPETIRQDRILHEALATGGDTRRLCDLFGITIAAAQQYTDVLHRPNEDALNPPEDP